MSSFTERQQRVTNTTGQLVFLELIASSFSSTLRAVNDINGTDWVSNGVTYKGVPFAFKLPDDTPGQVGRAVIEITNAGTNITDELEQRVPNEVIMAFIQISDRADPNIIEKSFWLPVTNVSVTPSKISLYCGVDFMTRSQCVRLRFTPHLTPGVFSL